MSQLISSDPDLETLLKSSIRDIPDFPKPGILFKDITPLLLDGALFQKMVQAMAAPFATENIQAIVGIESRGFLIGAPLAYILNAGFIPIRKPGKLPAPTHRVEYELEYGSDAVEIHRDAIHPGQRVLVVDDLLATGGTAAAAIRILEELGAEVVAASFIIELSFLKGREKLKPCKISSLIQY